MRHGPHFPSTSTVRTPRRTVASSLPPSPSGSPRLLHSPFSMCRVERTTRVHDLGYPTRFSVVTLDSLTHSPPTACPQDPRRMYGLSTSLLAATVPRLPFVPPMLPHSHAKPRSLPSAFPYACGIRHTIPRSCVFQASALPPALPRITPHQHLLCLSVIISVSWIINALRSRSRPASSPQRVARFLSLSAYSDTFASASRTARIRSDSHRPSATPVSESEPRKRTRIRLIAHAHMHARFQVHPTYGNPFAQVFTRAHTHHRQPQCAQTSASRPI